MNLDEATTERPIRLGRYDVTGLLRRGGMGAVYNAVERERGKRVALKTLSALDAEGLLRFKTEFRAAADLSHPNLVSLYELGCVDDLWFFTMERIDGVEFVHWVRGGDAGSEVEAIDPTRDEAPTTVEPTTLQPVTGGALYDLDPRLMHEEPSPAMPPSMTRLRDAFASLVRGVRAVHEAGLLHLDLKPGNVLVDRSGRVVVLDFGLVRTNAARAPLHLPTSLLPKTIAGTPEWMAPEQFDGDAIGEASDWYAVGLMLYAALTGVPAFPKVSPSATWYARAHLPPTPPIQLLSDIPEDLSALAVALLHSDPTRRPSGDTLVALTSPDEARRAPASHRIARTDLVGRDDERGALREAFRSVVAGETVVAHICGPSGVGKTALLESLRSDARSHGSAIVLRGRCYERETVPYKAFDGMFDELAAWLIAHRTDRVLRHLPLWINELSRIFPVLARVPAIAARLQSGDSTSSLLSMVEVRRRAMEALRELFTTLTEHHPVVLEIDDLQWADADSAALLGKLLEAPTPKRLLIAAAFRPTDATTGTALAPYFDLTGTLNARGDARLVSFDVGPLAMDAAIRLAKTTLIEELLAIEELSTVIANEAGGVPFFVLELARFAVQRREANAAASILAEGLSLETVLGQRVQSLPPTERELVEVLAVANSPIPLSIAFALAGLESGALRALWSLHGHQLARSTGVGPDDRIELQHDRMRQAVLAYLPPARVVALHLSLGRALAAKAATPSGVGPIAHERAAANGHDGDSPWLFDAVRHLNAVGDALVGEDRARAIALDLEAGRRARRAAAFPLAFDCFSAGVRLLSPDAWDSEYTTALALHGGAAECAYLSAKWPELDEHVAILKARGRTMLDQFVGWEAQIDGHIARRQYAPAVNAALDALRLLDVELPANPGDAEIGTELHAAMAALARVGPDGLESLARADDPSIAAAMRIQTRIGSAAYFARPALFPVLACRQIVMSVERGLSHATPYALSVYGIVLNALGMHREAHAWGATALGLIERFEDRSLEARTRHVIHDLVCVWVPPLATTLDDLRRVVDIGRSNGDIEYAAYAAHGYVHNALYAGRELTQLLTDAEAFTTFIRQHDQQNALHVHVPFERLLRCLTGRTTDRSRLNGDGFDEQAALAEAERTGSRSAQCIVRLVIGLARFHFGTLEEASAAFEAGRPFLDGVTSTWHVPMFHQYAALAIHGLVEPHRNALLQEADASLAALTALATHGPDNFAHRVALVSAARAHADREHDEARRSIVDAIARADAGGWLPDLAVAHALAAEIEAARADEGAAAHHRAAARATYQRWGAHAK